MPGEERLHNRSGITGSASCPCWNRGSTGIVGWHLTRHTAFPRGGLVPHMEGSARVASASRALRSAETWGLWPKPQVSQASLEQGMPSPRL